MNEQKEEEGTSGSFGEGREVRRGRISAPLARAESDEVVFGVIRDVPDLYTGRPFSVVVRNADHAFWTNCIAELNENKNKIVLRSSALRASGNRQRLFFSSGFCFCSRGKPSSTCAVRTKRQTNHYVELVPSDDTSVENKYNPRINIYPESTKQTKIDALYDPDAYFVVDPGETTASCDPEINVVARVVIVASPDERHWGGSSFTKRTPLENLGGMFRYFPPWTAEEPIGGSKELLRRAEVTEARVATLFQTFGGIPRQVFFSVV